MGKKLAKKKDKKKAVKFKQVVYRGCGIDVHKQVIVVSISGTGIENETKTNRKFHRIFVAQNDR